MFTLSRERLSVVCFLCSRHDALKLGRDFARQVNCSVSDIVCLLSLSPQAVLAAQMKSSRRPVFFCVSVCLWLTVFRQSCVPNGPLSPKWPPIGLGSKIRNNLGHNKSWSSTHLLLTYLSWPLFMTKSTSQSCLSVFHYRASCLAFWVESFYVYLQDVFW